MDKNKKLSRRDFIKITAVAGSVLAGGKLLSDLVKDEFVTVSETRLLMGTIINLAVVAESKPPEKQRLLPLSPNWNAR